MHLTMAVYTRLGCLFLDFKGKPATCALFFAVKLCKAFVKGALVGAFYGRWPQTVWLPCFTTGGTDNVWRASSAV